MKQKYVDINFQKSSLTRIATINDIINDYLRQGYKLTVRQLYYQLVAKSIIENTQRSYETTAALVNNARMAGMIDWDAIEDRTRSFNSRAHWNSPQDILDTVKNQYFEDMWNYQETRVFCIVEKEALAGVLSRVCNKFDIPLLAARGYPSSSVLREFVQDKILESTYQGQRVHILHLGDHDPSGIDMTRDLIDRIELFSGDDKHAVSLTRIALTMDQVEEQRPPPNPAKMTDSRVGEYIRRYGKSSWELDALNPSYLNNLVELNLKDFIDADKWEDAEHRIEVARQQLGHISENYDDIIAGLQDGE